MSATDDYLAKHASPLWYGEQDANGVDLSLIRENLKLTPHERLLRGDRARRSALRLLEYGRRHREQTAKEHIGRAKDRESLLQLLAILRLRSEQPPAE